MNSHQGREAGFTLIELIVVIVILGILAATALPKFVNLTADAQRSSVAGVIGGFNSAVDVVRARWMVNGAPMGTCVTPGTPNTCTLAPPTVTDVSSGMSVGVNSFGYPAATAGAFAETAGLSTAFTPTICMNIWQAILGSGAANVGIVAGAGIDWVATAATPICTYAYQTGGAPASPARSFTYNTSNGVMVVTNP